ncbi:MAG TPA: saccharopine dehydrogenase C-terminal domain-containing protein [Acidimicrobiia bacterium]|nr:saccharopine dehydrogenase C-terminal domain-containing protein [Acidimicrobiia bacterium]
MTRVAVLGTGIVGRAAAWDMVRRGHSVKVADRDPSAVADAAAVSGADGAPLEATDPAGVREFLSDADLVVSAVPYALGVEVARAAIDSGTHYLDFGGNPTVVGRQLTLDGPAREAGIALVPDCGLAPGLANVLAVGAVDALGPGPIDEVRLRVGALPAEPTGTLGYQLAFNPAGLINEYDEPCEILADGVYATVEPLTEVEAVEWPGWGPLEAFHTAGGSSSLPRMFENQVAELDYKTLRFPGHALPMRAMRETGLFSEEPQLATGVAPRAVLLEALRRHLPSGADDVVLVRVWATATRDGEQLTVGYQVDDRHDGTFSALARTTAFPATALAHLLLTGDVDTRGAVTMDGAIGAELMIRELEAVGIAVEAWP